MAKAIPYKYVELTPPYHCDLETSHAILPVQHANTRIDGGHERVGLIRGSYTLGSVDLASEREGDQQRKSRRFRRGIVVGDTTTDASSEHRHRHCYNRVVCDPLAQQTAGTVKDPVADDESAT